MRQASCAAALRGFEDARQRSLNHSAPCCAQCDGFRNVCLGAGARWTMDPVAQLLLPPTAVDMIRRGCPQLIFNDPLAHPSFSAAFSVMTDSLHASQSHRSVASPTHPLFRAIPCPDSATEDVCARQLGTTEAKKIGSTATTCELRETEREEESSFSTRGGWRSGPGLGLSAPRTSPGVRVRGTDARLRKRWRRCGCSAPRCSSQVQLTRARGTLQSYGRKSTPVQPAPLVSSLGPNPRAARNERKKFYGEGMAPGGARAMDERTPSRVKLIDQDGPFSLGSCKIWRYF